MEVPGFIEVVPEQGMLNLNRFITPFIAGYYQLVFEATLDANPAVTVTENDLKVILQPPTTCTLTAISLDPPITTTLMINYVVGDPLYSISVPTYRQDTNCALFTFYKLVILSGDANFADYVKLTADYLAFELYTNDVLK